MHVSFDKDNVVVTVSDTAFTDNGVQSVQIVDATLGQKLYTDPVKTNQQLRIAFICNWHTKCGISTYSQYLVDSMKPLVQEIRIFSEVAVTLTDTDGPEVERCWKRGECLIPLVKRVLAWKPDLIIIQHEYGIFPNAFYFMQMMQYFDNIPYFVTLHSVYEHLDKMVYSSCIKNIVVHTSSGRDLLRSMGHTGRIEVIPHGCVAYEDTSELWNICLNPYTVIQFGFGFPYKGVERGLEAIAYLKETDEKFKNIFYIVLVSENDYNGRHHLEYYNTLCDRIRELCLEENVVLIRRFHTEQMLCLYLRLAKLAIFPYLNNPNNTVYSASGAIRVALANHIPVIASESHLFDDLEGIVPRPKDSIMLAKEIDKVFSDGEYRQSIIDRCQRFQQESLWEKIAQMYIGLYGQFHIS